MMVFSVLFPLNVGREKTGFIQTANTHSDSVCVYYVWMKWAREAFPLTQSKYLSRNKILICHFPELKLSKQAKQTCDR